MFAIFRRAFATASRAANPKITRRPVAGDIKHPFVYLRPAPWTRFEFKVVKHWNHPQSFGPRSLVDRYVCRSVGEHDPFPDPSDDGDSKRIAEKTITRSVGEWRAAIQDSVEIGVRGALKP